MTPVPDCGEKTYVGSGRLKDRKALVTGAIPESVALPPLLTRVKGLTWRSVIFRGRRRRSGCEKIIEECGRKAVLLPGDLSDEKFARSLVHEAHKALGGLDIMALVAGKQVAIPDIADLTSEQFQRPLPLTFSRCSG